MSLVLEATHNKRHVSSRLLKLSRQMKRERLTVGTEEALRKDAEGRLKEFQKSRARANSTMENHSAIESI
jgi:hypothetical protein